MIKADTGRFGRLAVLASGAVLAACAPAPLYTSSGQSTGGTGRIAVDGEIPRDSRGEPLWHLIRPARGQPPILSLADVQAIARAKQPAAFEEGSAEEPASLPKD